MRAFLRTQLVVPLAVLAGAACTEEPFSPSEPDSAPGASAETREVTVSLEQFTEWRDTTYTGYALPVDATFRLAARAGSFEARVLARFPELPDSVFIEGSDAAVDSFPGGEVQVVIDTARSRIPETPFALRFLALERSFDPEDATWSDADSEESWTSPGGDLGVELGTLTLEDPSDSLLADTLRIPLSAGTDSVLRSWRENEGEPGSALLVEGSEEADIRLHLVSLRLAPDAAIVDQDTTIRVTEGGAVGSVPSTFVYDPARSDPGSHLRLGGLPAHRFYFVFEPPDSAEGISLRDGTINHAELVFPSETPPPAAYRLDSEIQIAGLELASDPLVTGPKTPVGAVQASDLSFDPAEGDGASELRLPVTALIQRWAAAPPDSVGPFQLGLAVRPDAAFFGHWNFGSAESDPLRRPFLRLLVTPSASFGLP